MFALLPVVLSALIINPQKYAECTLKGLNLWAFTVLPALLPFFFVTLLIEQTDGAKILSKTLSPVANFLYNTTGTAAAFISVMSYVSGYPLGAKLISEFYENKIIDRRQAEKMSVFCSTSGPSFIIGSVGASMLKSPALGAIIFVCHILSGVLTGVLFRKSSNKNIDNGAIAPLLQNKAKKTDLYSCAANVSLSCLCVGTLIAVFYVFSEILSDLKITYPIIWLLTVLLKDEKKAAAIVAGLFECTKGCFMLSYAGKNAIPLITALISFGGLSVIVQQMAFLSKAKVRFKYFMAGKLVMTVISFFLAFIACKIFL